MEKLVRCQVVLRPTNDKLGVIRHNTYSGQWYLPNQVAPNHPEVLKYHMDIVCNQFPALPGDWILLNNHSDPIYIESLEQTAYIDTAYPNNLGKIIASTDKVLRLPSVSQDFIDKFVEISGKITDVLVYYDISFTCTQTFKCRPCLQNIENPIECSSCKYLGKKIRPLATLTDRGFVLRPCLIKDSWSKEEVIELVTKAFEDGMMYGGYAEEWIEKNIKDYGED